jgi:hypothetical protein
MKRSRAEQREWTFERYEAGLDGALDAKLPDSRSVAVDVQLLVDEARISCTSGMLLCLDRDQRLIYILGEIFGVTDKVGAELLDQSRQLSPETGPSPSGSSPFHAESVRAHQQVKPLPVRQENPSLHECWLRES